MEFDVSISKLQGVILSLRRRGLLNKPDPNETELKELKVIFDSLPDEKLRLVYFLILNTDLPISKRLSSDENLGPMICITPPLSQSLVLQLIWKLKLQEPWNEIIENCSSALTGNLIGSFTQTISPKIDYMNDLCQFWCSLFKKIHNIHAGHQEDRGNMKLSLCFQKLSEIIQKCFIIYKGSNDDSSQNILAASLLVYFKSILTMVRLYNNVNYNFEKNELFEGAINIFIEADVVLPEPSKTCLNVVFKFLQKIIKIITVDLWMSLLEISAGCDYNISAQEMIGEICYYLVRETTHVSPDYLKCLEIFILEPKSKLERLMAVEEGQNDSADWNDALNSYLSESSNGKKTSSFNPFGDEKFLDRILECLDEIDVKQINRIMGECLNLLKGDSSNHENKLRELFLKALEKAENVDYNDLIREIYWTHPEIGEKFEEAQAKSEDFNEKLTKTFNQNCSEKYPKISDIFSLCLESREKTLLKIFQIATSGLEQSEFFANVLNTLKDCFTVSKNSKISEVSLFDTVLETVIMEENFSEKEKKCFVSFYTKILEFRLVDCFFFSKILNLLNIDLVNERYDKAIFHLELIQSGTGSEFFDEQRLLFLAFMPQVLEYFLWGSENFSALRCRGLELAGQIVSSAIRNAKKEKVKAESKRAEFVFEQITKQSELTKVRFCEFWRFLDLDWPPLPSTLPNLLFGLVYTEDKDRIMSLIVNGKSEADLELSIVKSLLTVLPRLTSDLWTSIFEAVKLVCEKMAAGKDDFMVDYHAIDLFFRATNFLTIYLNENPKFLSCYEYCLRNMWELVKTRGDKFLNVHSRFVLEKMILVLHKINDDDQRKTCILPFVPNLLDLIHRSRSDTQKKLDFDVLKFVTLLRMNKVEEAVKNRFGHVNNLSE